jgi:transcriptional regulator with XRE-family HTH domain
MEIGHRIKQARQNAGLSQRRLAKAIGVTHGSVGQWESHKKMPGRENLRLIAETTGVSADQLLGQPSAPIEAKGGEEAKLLIKFRQMSQRQRKNLLELVDMSADLNRQAQHERHPLEAE